MIINDFELTLEYDSLTLNSINISDIHRSTINYNIALEKTIDNRYSIRRISDIDCELQESFIYDGYYCSNMKSYIFFIGECTSELIESFYDKLTKFIVKYNIDPVDFRYVIGDGCSISDDMKLKLSKISSIQFNLHDYS